MSEKKNKFSIITAVKDPNLDLFRKNIKSIKEQTFKDYEHLIIDGSNKFNIKNTLKKLNYSPNKLILNENKGIYNALNKGILSSNSKYIMFLHSDDILFEKNTLKKINDNLNTSADIYVSGIIIKGKKFLRNWLIKSLNDINIYKCKLPPHTGLIIKYDIYKKYGLFNTQYKISSDIEFMMKIFKDKSNLIVEILNDYSVIMNSGGASTRLSGIIKSNVETYKILKSFEIKNPLLLVLKKIIIKIKQLRFNLKPKST